MTPVPDPTIELEAVRARFGGGAARSKRALLARIAATRLDSGEVLWRLHEALLFLCAYPDSPAVLAAAEAGLAGFAARLEPLAGSGSEAFDALDEKGIAGTSIYTAFSLPMARWLAARFPGAVDVYLDAEGVEDRLGEALGDLLLPAEAEAVADRYLEAFAWLRRTAPRDGRNALERLLAIVESRGLDAGGASAMWTALELPLRWDLGAGAGSRSLARAPHAPPVFRPQAAARGPVDLRADAAPAPVHPVTGGVAGAWIDVARAAVAARLREVHTFNHASPDDVAVVVLGDGLRLALYGVAPPHRHALRVFYGYLLVRNDVPIGYGDALMVADWGEINFHIFETFRGGGGSAAIYSDVVRVFRHHFGIRYLFLNRYQFGHHNPDAIRSGAFWFYEKLGFRPHERAAAALWRRERRRLDRDPAYRSDPVTLRRLAHAHMGMALAEPVRELESAYRGFHPMNIGLRATRRIESTYGGDRARATRAAVLRVKRAVGGRWSADEARALERLAPVVDLIAGLESWTRDEKKSLGRVVRAKAATHERDHLLAAQANSRLRAGLITLGSARS